MISAESAHGVHAYPGVYGLLAEFKTTTELVEAAYAATRAGYTHTDGYSPFPIAEMDDALQIRKTRIPWLILCAGLTGCFGGFGMQWFANVVHYPINIGGRPLNSWPMFIPVTFELTILLSALTAVFGMLIINGFPQPYHPVFNVPSFAHASQDSFFLLIESSDPKFDRDGTMDFMRSLNAHEVTEVAP
ncbi:MAG: DUF3341 domain-containing protein [Candidatus Sumerlaeaceae bacterium]